VESGLRRSWAAMLLVASTYAHAVYLNSHGLGQVLVYPYYTANGNNATLLSIFNSTDKGKALKVRFHEGYDGRDVLDFNVYLGPHDAWTGGVGRQGDGPDALARLITTDDSCTVPEFAPMPGVGPAGRFLDFTDANYAGSVSGAGTTGNADGGPMSPGRTREGHFDVFEMGEVTDATRGSLTAMAPADGAAPDCAQIVAAWSAGGYWSEDPTTDLAPPAGGIYGTEAVIDVAQGTFFSTVPEAIDGFSTTIQHTPPAAPAPDLHTASKSGNGSVAAFVALGGRMVELDYANPVDAISALFMTDSLYNEFNTNPGIGALTDGIVTAPTKRYYVDPAHIGNTVGAPAARPFEQGFLESLVAGAPNGGFSSFPYSCVGISATEYDRSGAGRLLAVVTPNGPRQNTQVTPCLETSVLTFSTQSVPGPFGNDVALPLSALGSELTNGEDPYGLVFNGVGLTPVNQPVSEGTLRLDLVHDLDGKIIESHELTAATNGDVLVGLPVIGFAVENYVNANVTLGVLANYSGVYPHRTSVACTRTTAPDQECLP
jgi:hypothetical protein